MRGRSAQTTAAKQRCFTAQGRAVKSAAAGVIGTREAVGSETPPRWPFGPSARARLVNISIRLCNGLVNHPTTGYDSLNNMPHTCTTRRQKNNATPDETSTPDHQTICSFFSRLLLPPIVNVHNYFLRLGKRFRKYRVETRTGTNLFASN